MDDRMNDVIDEVQKRVVSRVFRKLVCSFWDE